MAVMANKERELPISISLKQMSEKEEKMNILVIMAEPNDVSYLCGGTLEKYLKNGHRVFIALMTKPGTPTGWDVPIRYLGFQKGSLSDGMEERAAVLTAIRWAEADIIFSYSPWDPVPDHARTVKLIMDSILIVGGKLHPASLPPINKKTQLFFCDIAAKDRKLHIQVEPSMQKNAADSFVPNRGFGSDLMGPEAYVDISDVIDAKLSHLSADTDACEIQSRLRGLQTGCRYAEVFAGHRIHGNFADLRKLP